MKNFITCAILLSSLVLTSCATVFPVHNPDMNRDEYAGLIDSIKAGQAEDGCWLYMMNVYGNDKSVGYVLADVSENKVVVLDIAAGECPNSAENKTFRFLFKYCGVIFTSPEIEHVEVDLNVPEGSCPSFDSESEWVGTVN